MNKQKFFITLSLLFVAFLPVAAQTDDIVADDEYVPFGLQEAEDDEVGSFFEANFLSPLDDEVELEDINPFFSDEYYAERLKAIPGPEEFHVFNSIVKSYIDRYATNMRRSVSIMLGKYNLYGNIFDDILDRYDLPEVLRFLPVIESGLNPTAKSRAGAGGLWQFMPSTGKSFGLDINSWVDERNDPYLSTDAAARMLKRDYEQFGDWSLVLAAYNCGAGNVSKAIARAGGVKDFWVIYPYLPRETRGYVPAFIAATYIMNNYSQHNIKARKTIKAIEVDTAVVHYDLYMEQIADVCGITVEEIRSFNPQYKTTLIPGGRRHSVIALPIEQAVRFAGVEDSLYHSSIDLAFNVMPGDSTLVSGSGEVAELENAASAAEAKALTGSAGSRSSAGVRNARSSKSKSRSSSASRGKEITVRSGDNLGAIAKRNHTTVAELKRKNKLKGDQIRAGQKLRVK
ncbi:MAG: transglycosylase SLT domain-containing protein [Prevotellaceae bacterium]|nr:transglycosylase SLT domain-containing protein [Prevotellaceae bacterium]